MATGGTLRRGSLYKRVRASNHNAGYRNPHQTEPEAESGTTRGRITRVMVVATGCESQSDHKQAMAKRIGRGT